MAPFYFSVALSANVRTMHWQSPMACAAGAVVNQNQSVMKAKIKSTGEIIEVEKIDGKKGLYGRVDGIVAIYHANMLDFSAINPTPKQKK